RHAAVELDDVAEFAGERTAARELHPDIEILVELEQIEARDRRRRDVGLEFRALEIARALSGLPRRDEVLDDALGFAENPEVAVLINVAMRGDVGPADHDRLAQRLRHRGDAQ